MKRPENNTSPWKEILKTGKLEGRDVLFFETTSSTNSVALDEGRKGAASGTLVIADAQEKGRGRLGKSWLSPPGSGLYFSMIKRPDILPADLPKITLAVGCALCKALEESLGISPQIKWPNDLLLAGKKCGGVLAESSDIYGNTPLVIIGIGLNLSTPQSGFPPELQSKATSLAEHMKEMPEKRKLLLSIVKEIDDVIMRLEHDRFPEILAEWKQRDATLGKTLNWLTPDCKVVSGISQGPDRHGQLHIRDKEGNIHAVLSGDISLCDKK